MTRRRVALAQMSCESNTFARFTCDLRTVRATGFLHEDESVFALRGSDNELAGALDIMDADGEVEVVPLLAARWNSSAILTRDAHRYLVAGIVDRLRGAGPIDGVLLSCHGSMVADGTDDAEGDLAAAVRAVVGRGTPVGMTLDLHANVTDRMIRQLDFVVGYEHYPHDDAFTTGARAARLLIATARRSIRPAVCRVRLPMILSSFNASTTGDGPFARLEHEARATERSPGILSVSVFHVGSYIDVAEIGCSAVVVTDDNPALARRVAENLAVRYWTRRAEFLVETVPLDEALRRGGTIDGPVLLLNTSDTTGGGASGDGIAVTRGLIAAGVTDPAITQVVDPVAAAACHAAGVGSELELDVGHGLDSRWGRPLHLHGRVAALTDGSFRYGGGIFGGTEASMGPSAVIGLGSLRLLVMTHPTYEWGDEQYHAAGLDPRAAKWVEVKNMMNFRREYAGIMGAYFVLDIPGPTPPDMRSLGFERARRPWFPLDPETPPDFQMAERVSTIC